MSPDGNDANKVPLIAVSPSFKLSKRLAIVGNSSSLKETEFGREIDSYEDVLRFNGALTDGFEERVGSKTTVQIMGIDIAYLFNPKYVPPTKDPVANEERRRENAKRICEFFPDGSILTFSPHDAERNNNNRQYATALYIAEADPGRTIYHFEEEGRGSSMTWDAANRDFEELGLKARLKHGGPRTGMKTVIRCVLSGIKPTLFGFDIDTSLEFVRHYYDDVVNDEIANYKPHDMRGEMFVLIEMIEHGLIEIRQ